jgi:hypothetical protein
MVATSVRLSLVAVLAIASAAAQAQDKAALQELRTKRLMPLSTAPKFEWQRIQKGYAFLDAHRKSIQTTHVTTSVLTLFAGRDTLPVIDFTGKLLTDYRTRMARTSDLMSDILATPKVNTDFTKQNYKRAVDLGLIHLQISQAAKIKWDPKVRVPGNQQSFGLVFYAYAWQPVEKMLASNEIDAVKDARAIEDWLYLWNVLGYGMGVDTRLLPKSAKQTSELVRWLRGYQYPVPGEEIPRQVRALIRNQMSYLYFLRGNGAPIDDTTKREVRKILAEQIAYSPGLSQALGLGTDPLEGLNNLDRTID